MFILRWYKEYLDIKAEYAKSKIDLQFCESCETLKLQLSIANEEKKQLLSKLIDKPEPVEVNTDTPSLKPVLPGNSTSWQVRRQALEREDRAQAKLLHHKKGENARASLTVPEIEKELEVNE